MTEQLEIIDAAAQLMSGLLTMLGEKGMQRAINLLDGWEGMLRRSDYTKAEVTIALGLMVANCAIKTPDADKTVDAVAEAARDLLRYVIKSRSRQ